MKRLPLLLLAFLLLPLRAEEGVDSRLARAEENVALARASEQQVRARLEQIRGNSETPPDSIEAMERYLEEVSALRATHEETLADLLKLAETRGDPAVTQGLHEFQNHLATLPEAEDPDSDLKRMLAEFESSLNLFDQMLLDHGRKVRDEMDRRIDAGNDAATSRAQAAAEAAALLRGMGVDPGVPETSTNAGAGTNTATGAGKPRTEEIPSSPTRRDEDIVARQLREAAEKETDPALREKLWKEYEDYLNGRS